VLLYQHNGDDAP